MDDKNNVKDVKPYANKEPCVGFKTKNPYKQFQNFRQQIMISDHLP